MSDARSARNFFDFSYLAQSNSEMTTQNIVWRLIKIFSFRFDRSINVDVDPNLLFHRHILYKVTTSL